MRINQRKLFQMAAAIPPGLERKEAPDLEAEIKAIKTEILAGINGSAGKMRAMQSQLDALDVKLAEKHAAAYEGKSLVTHLQENDNLSRLLRDKKGSAAFSFPVSMIERKTILSSALGNVTPGVIDADRDSGIVREAQRKLTVRDVLTSRPTTQPLIYWVKVNSPLVSASPMMQYEGATKHENAVTFTTANSTIRTIATFVKCSRQAIEDFGELAGFLQSDLPYYCNRQIETQLLSGDNTHDNLNGLLTQSGSFDTSLLVAATGWTRIDQVGAAIQQIGSADEIDPSFIILNKTDWWRIRRLKDSLGRYLLGDPQSVGNPRLWDLTTVPTNSIASGTFLIGSGDPAAAEIRTRQEMEVLISTEDGTNFRDNLVSVRAETRMCLVCKRPGALVSGTFTSSP